MAKTYYEILGVTRKSSAAEIRSAYRKLVLKHHPDQSTDPRSRELFLAATEAYEVLNDPERKRSYDERLEFEAKRRAEARARTNQARQPSGPPQPRPQPSPKSTSTPRSSVAADVARMTSAFSRGQYAEAERLARQVIRTDPRQPVPYAILGDIARGRRDFSEAAKMYAYAVQMDPRNAVYQRLHEQLLSSNRVESTYRKSSIEPNDMRVLAPLAGGAVTVLAAFYVALSTEKPFLTGVALASTWTLGLLAMLFLSGVAVGSSLSIGNLMDRFMDSAGSSVGRVGPAIALGTVAVVNFWAAVILYVALGIAQRAFRFSMTTLLGGVATATLVLALAAAASPNINGWQVVAWGGNIVYVGACCGWMVADALRS